MDDGRRQEARRQGGKKEEALHREREWRMAEKIRVLIEY